jgi:hypothetical protein
LHDVLLKLSLLEVETGVCPVPCPGEVLEPFGKLEVLVMVHEWITEKEVLGAISY